MRNVRGERLYVGTTEDDMRSRLSCLRYSDTWLVISSEDDKDERDDADELRLSSGGLHPSFDESTFGSLVSFRKFIKEKEESPKIYPEKKQIECIHLFWESGKK